MRLARAQRRHALVPHRARVRPQRRMRVLHAGRLPAVHVGAAPPWELEAPVLEAPAAYAADRPDPGAAVARQMSPACEFLAVALRTGSLVGLFTFHN